MSNLKNMVKKAFGQSGRSAGAKARRFNGSEQYTGIPVGPQAAATQKQRKPVRQPRSPQPVMGGVRTPLSR